MAKGWLRTNFMRTAGAVALDGIGGQALHGSWVSGGGAAACYVPYGGFIMGSIDTRNSVILIDPSSAMFSYFGAGYPTGYKILPVNLIWRHLTSNTVSGDMRLHVSMTATGSECSCAHIYMGGSVTSILTISASAHFVWAGFIISTP